MTIDKAKLKALAEAATPGPWHAENDRHEGSINADYRHIGMVSMFCRVREDVERNFANQRFIAAANPATTLALLAEIERLELIGRISCNFDGYKAVLDERDQLKAEKSLAEEARDLYAADKKSLAFALNDARAEAEALRKALADCAVSLKGEMLQKFGDRQPEEMHPVTRREYDRDMAEVAGFQAMVKEASHG